MGTHDNVFSINNPIAVVISVLAFRINFGSRTGGAFIYLFVGVKTFLKKVIFLVRLYLFRLHL